MADQLTPSTERALTVAFLLALAAMLGALFIGEVLGQAPCRLCWYQRIAMFPLAPILGVALWRGEAAGRFYALPLVFAGIGAALWHSGLYAGVISEAVSYLAPRMAPPAPTRRDRRSSASRCPICRSPLLRRSACAC
jgi:disulfide bond formation protein DsbB